MALGAVEPHFLPGAQRGNYRLRRRGEDAGQSQMHRA